MKYLPGLLLALAGCATTATQAVPGRPVGTQPDSAAASASARFVTGDPAAKDGWPCFSPDGKVVLFSRTLDDGKSWALYIVPSAGGPARPLAPSPLPVSATRPNWSRHGPIAFAGTSADEKIRVWIIDADGTNAHEVETTGVSNELIYPSWYPDGEHLAAMDSEELVVKRFDRRGGAATAVTDHAKVLTGMPNVSPDGKWVVFAGQKNAGQPYDQLKNSLWLVGESGDLRPVESGLGQGRAPAWSPDGSRIVFESSRGDAHEQYAVFTIRPDGTGLTQVMSHELNAQHPVWSRDGTRLVFDAVAPKGTGKRAIAILDAPRL